MQNRRNQWGGHICSTSGWAWIPRDRAAANDQIHVDYFCENPLYAKNLFRQCSRMSKPLFERTSPTTSIFFPPKERCYAYGAPCLSAIQKMIEVLRMLAYGMPTESINEYVKIAKSTTIETPKKFRRRVLQILQLHWDCQMKQILPGSYMWQARAFPGMLGSLDCMHWRWEKCPTTYHNIYTGHVKSPPHTWSCCLIWFMDLACFLWEAYCCTFLYFAVLPCRDHLRHCSLLFIGGRTLKISPHYPFAQIVHYGSLKGKI